jgi:hypothetical protein
MNRNFINDGLSIDVQRRNDNTLVLSMSSEFSQTNHKGKLWVNEKSQAQKLEDLWKSIKTKKLLRASLGFSEVDWYDDEVDVYETPYFRIERGLKRARIGYSTHGSIPKDWDVHVSFVFADTTTNTPILEAIQKTLYSMFTPEIKKQFIKKLRPVLQKKEKYCSIHTER